jgi:diketogulonate reductase-like aldo/keto reductase
VRGLYIETWSALEELYATKRVGSIGVSNFLPEHLDRLMQTAQVVPAVDQIELHPSYQQRELTDRLRSLGITVEAYSPLGQAADLTSSVVESIARTHETTPAAVILRWHLQRGHVVIPKSANSQRMRDNLECLRIDLASEEVAAITALDSGNRIGGDPAVIEFSQIR